VAEGPRQGDPFTLRVEQRNAFGEGDLPDLVNEPLDLRPGQRDEDPVVMDVELHRGFARGRPEASKVALHRLDEPVELPVAAEPDRPTARSILDLGDRLL